MYLEVTKHISQSYIWDNYKTLSLKTVVSLNWKFQRLNNTDSHALQNLIYFKPDQDVLALPFWRDRFGAVVLAAARFGALPFWRRTFWRKYIQISTQYMEAGIMKIFLPNKKLDG